MDEIEEQRQGGPGPWRAIWEFPLTAMIAGSVLVVLVVIGVGAFNQAVVQPAVNDPWSTILGTLIAVGILFVIYKLAIRKLGRKKHDDLPLGPAMRDTALGFGLGGVLISLCVGLAAAAGVYTIEGPGLGSDLVQIIFITGVFAGFMEELLLRGIIFRWLEEFAGSWIALALSSLLFGFLHGSNDNATFFSSLAIAIEAGILLGAAYMLTRSLWLAVGIHAGWNVIQGFWNVPISGNDFDGLVQARLEGPDLLAGGGFGLEATVFALLVATGTGIWLLVKAVRRGRVVPPMWKRKGAQITAY